MIETMKREEIERLGFSHKSKAVDDWYEMEGEFNMGSWTSYKMIMHYGKDARMFISVEDAGEEVSVFQGVVQNVEQFKILLEMICIE